MVKHVPLHVCPPATDGGRPVTLGGVALGVAYNTADVVRFLRQAGIDDSLIALDDRSLIEWQGGGPEVWE
ncbi:hypothetical protein OG863_38775 [Streptomyces decoyicus]|uniref:Uncharacterized protein n=1 Tax=Streptomyces decoyicus TaxID=249567 RepID=A0ABZ1FSJ2_9ACTN|nr:hypothetical protein OG863_38775 [Streptomyces decoyicus]